MVLSIILGSSIELLDGKELFKVELLASMSKENYIKLMEVMRAGQIDIMFGEPLEVKVAKESRESTESTKD